jgi:hypothetical protein
MQFDVYGLARRSRGTVHSWLFSVFNLLKYQKSLGGRNTVRLYGEAETIINSHLSTTVSCDRSIPFPHLIFFSIFTLVYWGVLLHHPSVKFQR